jgi:uncharacterized protein (DUF983 family)
MHYSISEIITGVFSNHCPNCGQGSVYKTLITMNETCPECGYKFEKESGYFLGSLSITYTISFLIILPMFLILLFSNQPLWLIIGAPTLTAILLNPLIRRMARLIWIWVDYSVTPKNH